ncbi:alkaline phosphatase [Pseudoxanthomonas sacheonensis]|uniref:Alkaline phosphatase n=1 Tax=Pseudoxanthomonas sacheonensis TaxID=443615 RepID=A0ABU1RVL1_9GAMM|nr:alkaline phosphatase [Pseudoxanthomonas sacheonensis]MDR6841955.1 alkaline phosphatase [Pseudoxanthomonas sacheonensis]
MRHLSTVLGCAALTMLIAGPGLTAEPEHIRGKASNKRAAAAPAPARGESAQQWYSDGARAARAGAELRPSHKKAKNVILFVGDGMGLSTVAAARILEGQLKGRSGEENALSFERFPYLSLSKTYSVDGQTADSAPTMTAMMTGIKTNQGVLGVTQEARYNNCASAKGKSVASLLEVAEALGMNTGIVSTARITHATPAATYAHTPNRDWESDAELSAEAKTSGCKDIARQLVEFPYGDGLEVALGGGRSYFLPSTLNDPEDTSSKGRRLDGRNLASEWSSRPASAYVWNKAQFDAINPATTRHLLGLFERSHMEYEADRPLDAGKEPSLAEMTAKSIDILQARNGNKGYFLMVEGGRVDHAHHAGNASRALVDAIALSDAVRTAMRKSSAEDTLIIVTADHSHTFTIAGYPDRGNNILGKVVTDGTLALDADGKPYTTLGYINGPGYRGAAARPDLTNVDTANVNFLQEAAVPMASETHAAEDVGIYATGPGAHAFQGVVEQNVIFHVMAQSQKDTSFFFCSLFGGCGKNDKKSSLAPPLLEADLRAGMAKQR